MSTLNVCKPPETELERLVLGIDRFIISRVGLKRPKAYGLAERFLDKGKSVYLADNDLNIDEGELATWDDRYDATWFHFCNSISTQSTGGYGKSQNIKQANAMSLIAWAKRKTIDTEGIHYTTQLGLSERFSIAINYGTSGRSAVTGVELDMPNIEAAFFAPNRISKESILFRVNYNLIVNVVPACLPELCEPEVC